MIPAEDIIGYICVGVVVIAILVELYNTCKNKDDDE